MKNVIFIAPPAAGKGTQSDMLCSKYDYVHISTGDILREVVASGTDEGLKIKDIIEKGNLVGDDIILKLIKDKLDSIGDKAYILDGFPRTIEQAKYLDNLIDDNYVVLYLDLDKDSAIKRINGRVVCSCGKSYNLESDDLKPKQDGICDVCGKTLIKRDDDNIDSFKVRFDNFISNTKPLVEYYDAKNKIIKIDVNRSKEDIFNSISKEVIDD